MLLSNDEEEVVKRSILLADLNNVELQRYLDISSTASFDKNKFLFREGESNDNLYLILKGMVDLYKDPVIPGDEPYLIGTLGPGQSIGEMRVVNNRPCALSVMAKEPTKVLSTPILELQKSENYTIYISLLHSANTIMSNRLFVANELIVKHMG